MASNINPNNIDTTYPIAGQDNDSQGFRDNFTNIKSNFAEAESEIDDLQSKVVLKSALTGTTLDNDFDGALVSSAKIQDFRESVVALGTTNGTLTLNHNAGHYYTVTLNASGTVALSNFPPSGSKGRIQLQVTISNTAHTLTLPAAVNGGVVGIQGYSSNVITFNTTGTYIFEFISTDGGTTYHVEELSRPRNVFQNGITAPSVTLSAFATLTPLSSAPSSPTSGMIAVDDGTDWSGVATSGTDETVVAYLNGGWVKLG